MRCSSKNVSYQSTIGSLCENLLAGLHRLVKQHHGVGDEGRQDLSIALCLSKNIIKRRGGTHAITNNLLVFVHRQRRICAFLQSYEALEVLCRMREEQDAGGCGSSTLAKASSESSRSQTRSEVRLAFSAYVGPMPLRVVPIAWPESRT